jgi:N-acetylmuramoyl-L-alanine amidase
VACLFDKLKAGFLANAGMQSGLGLFLFGASLVALAFLFVPQAPVAQAQPDQKQLTVYTSRTSYSLPVVNREGQEYVGLIELLEPIGTVSGKFERDTWKLRFSNREGLFTTGSAKCKVNKEEVDLSAPFVVETGRGFVPLHALPQLLAQILPGRPLVFHEQTRRLFLDKVELRYAAEIRKGAAGQLVITFSAPVNPFIATEPGKLRMIFRHEPLLAGGQGETQKFDDKSISLLTYSESNGNAELTVNSQEALMAFFSADGKTITLTPANTVTATTPKTPSPSELPSGSAANIPHDLSGVAKAPNVPSPRGFLVVVDAAHGGEERGGAITEQLAEKQVDLVFARRLSSELQTRGIACRLLRDADVTLTPEQRTALANAAVPSLYVAMHATASGTGIHVVTSNLAPAPATSVFLPWETAQTAFVNTSRAVADDITTELLKRDIPTFAISASVAPLNTIAAPALAIEVALPPTGGVAGLTSASYEQTVSSAIANAVAATRGRLPHAGAGQ